MSATKLAEWKPRELIANARRQDVAQFTTTCESPYLLLIRLDDPHSELAVGLDAQEQQRDSLAFQTVERSVDSVVRSLDSFSPPPRAQGHRSTTTLKLKMPPIAALSDRLLLHMSTGVCHVLPLRKHSEAAFLRGISVGRARNHDIVLRHRSVSKFHGSFDIDDDGRVFVRDANSSNHTFVNAKQIEERVELRPGDDVQFGSVQTHLCTTEDFWRQVRG